MLLIHGTRWNLLISIFVPDLVPIPARDKYRKRSSEQCRPRVTARKTQKSTSMQLLGSGMRVYESSDRCIEYGLHGEIRLAS